ncbi:Glycosyltransferase, GT2 family [Luteibacter sp. UNCMF331Sha3.1]|nr:Glycosyltransferase, GT2 family [Luteibacter sp. UNCMF331Sha3.1]
MNDARRKLDVVMPVYRDAVRASDAIEALLACTAPDMLTVRLRIVDDGSLDGTAEALESLFGGRIDIVRLPRNVGRSAARNAGVAGSDADLLLFIDADCVPDNETFLLHHIDAMANADVSIGSIEGLNDGFWHAYQGAATARRERLSRHSAAAAFTTQNVMIDARLFRRVGGFDEAYRGYGFEDRDLAMRMMAAGARFGQADGARVVHRDSLVLEKVCAKMREAGETTAARFARLHPAEYRALGYEAIDATKHPWRGLIARATWPAVRLAVRYDGWINWGFLPFAARKTMVRMAVAIHFLQGTMRQRR